MTIRTRCQHCGEEYTLPTKRAGQVATCRECGGRFRVESASRRSSARAPRRRQDEWDADWEDWDEEHYADDGNRAKLGLILAAVGGGVVILITVLILVLTGGGETPAEPVADQPPTVDPAVPPVPDPLAHVDPNDARQPRDIPPPAIRPGGDANPVPRPAAAPPPQGKLTFDLDQPFGALGYSIRPPEGFEPTDVDQEADEVTITWQAPDGQPETELEFSVERDATVSSRIKPRVITTSGRFPGGRMHIYTGSQLTWVDHAGISFARVFRPARRAGDESMLVYIGYFDGAIVHVSADTQAPPDGELFRLLERSMRSIASGLAVARLPEVDTGVNIDVAAQAPPKNTGGADSGLTGFGARPGAGAAEPPGPVDADGTVRIPLAEKHNAEVIAAPAPHPFVFVEGVSYDARNGERVGRFGVDNRSLRTHGPWVLNTTGTRLAHVTRDNENGEVPVTVHAGDGSGSKTLTLTMPKEAGEDRPRVDYARFLDEKRLLINAGKFVIVVDVESGELVKSFETGRFDREESAVSVDGEYLAVAETRKVSVYAISKGRVVAEMASLSDPRKAFPFALGFAFSPDTQELAVLFRDQIACWSARGQLIYEHAFTEELDNVGYDSDALVYLPDGSGWLFNGRALFLKERHQLVWKLQPHSFYRDTAGVLIGDERVLVPSGDIRSGALVSRSIPWDKIGRPVAGEAESVEALLKKGQAVGLDVNVGEVRFAERGQVASQLSEALTNRLRAIGNPVAEGQPLTLVVRYAEAAGDTRKVVGPFRQETGRSVQDTEITLSFALVERPGAEPVWTKEMKFDGGLIISGEPTDANVRKETFEDVLRRMQSFTLPTFIPKAAGGTSFPIIETL